MELLSRFEQTAATQPDKPAIIYSSKQTNVWKQTTYRSLFDQTQRFLSGLQACSLTPGAVAIVMIPPSAEFFPFALALLKFGIMPVIFDPAMGLKKVGEVINESKPEIFFGNRLTHALRILFGWGRDSIKHNLMLDNLLRASDHEAPVSQSAKPSDIVAVIYTSGSTGLPKGAVYTRANFAAQLESLKNTFHISADEVDLAAFPLYALIDLLLGVTVVIPDISFPVPGKTNPRKTISAIRQFNVTNMFASPVVLEILANETRHSIIGKLPSLKRVITAGAPATIHLQEVFRQLLDDHTDLFGIYGATETLPIAKVESREIFALKEKTEQGAGICLGKPIESVIVRIIPITDESIEEWMDSLLVQSSVVGEITVQSCATTREYFHREKSNRLSKIRLGDEIIHRMGDVGYFDEEGRLWYCGRKSHRVVTQDDVLFTEQVENIFNTHSLVKRTALVEVKRKPVLWVELERGTKTSQDRMLNELKKLAKDHRQASQISTFLFARKFPTDVRHNSKIIREELKALAEKRLA
ncbi:MAG TPA: fatty acid CoA ligase family protein [Anaerolineales bacterium]|nr:AMP-binding protein [Anaerolineales bacterium]HMS01147.1 fatty acid CoA ligase family protein [Anaerolineales bacterium]HNQ95385.1 fatty acid CoA ligase family protein [Anaerolineales bacterium]HNS61890.1 fatty acid CoA ligase family protein [Anaerolineales bacterium]